MRVKGGAGAAKDQEEHPILRLALDSHSPQGPCDFEGTQLGASAPRFHPLHLKVTSGAQQRPGFESPGRRS